MNVKIACITTLLLLFFIQFGESFRLRSYKWPNAKYEYFVNPDNADVGRNAAIAGIKLGSNVWKAFCPGTFKGLTSAKLISNNGQNTVFFRPSRNGNQIATTYAFKSADGKTILGFDIVFWDAAWRFFGSSAVCNNGFYIADIAAHEFGHVIGLADSGVLGATQNLANYRIFCNKSLRSLSDDDKAGAAQRYGSGPTNLKLECGTSEPSSGPPGLQVRFYAGVTGGSGNYAFLWKFGDGGQSDRQNVNHTFTSPGTYLPNVTVTSGGAQAQCATNAIEIKETQPQPDIAGPSKIEMNDSTSATVKIQNDGNATLNIFAVNLITVTGANGAITLDSDQCGSKAIGAGQSCNIDLTCCPSCIGQTAGATGILRISNNDPNEDPFDVNLICNAP